MNLYLDTETCGLHGVPVLIQYALDDGEIKLYSIWTNSTHETMELIEWFCNYTVVTFNAAFDWFHLTKIYNMFRLLGKDVIPLAYIDELAELEPLARDGVALKPKHCFDLMMHARKGPYQSLMDRNPIKIKRVPTPLAYELANELTKRIPMKDVYFERSSTGQRWKVQEIRDKVTDEVIPEFKNVVLDFAPSSALKALAVDALNIDHTTRFKDVELDKKFRPVEYGYAPFAKAERGAKPGNWKGTWPSVLERHIAHWAYNKEAREYAKNDIVYTRDLFKYFNPAEVDDDDSVLAYAVGTIRWKGFKVDIEGLKNLKKEAKKLIASTPTAPAQVKKYILEVMEPIERSFLLDTKGQTLEHIATWLDHPAGARAREVLDARHAQKEIELYDKLILAGRFHASFKVIGTLSSRMSGADGLNPQGIKRAYKVRSMFPLKFDDEDAQLDGGDFDSFEISIMDAAYPDPLLHEECTVGKIHAHWGAKYFFPHMTYDEIIATKGQEPDIYTLCKNGVFAVCYFGEGYTLITRVGLEESVAEAAYFNILEDHPDFRDARNQIIDKFCSMKQPNGLGTMVEWHEPAEYVESLLGFKRYYTLENQVCRALFDLAQKPPEHWRNIKMSVIRNQERGVQTATGATMSAIYAAAFGVQGAAMRSAGNHVIQSTGGEITKNVQRRIWDIQPVGAHEFLVRPINIHDEIMSVNNRHVASQVETAVNETVEKYRTLIPLIGMEWKQNIKNWAEKG